MEHYEIAGYGCARTYAQLLDDKNEARLLDTSIREEGDTNKKLTRLAKSVINLRAKKAVKKMEKKKGMTGVIKGLVKTVMG